MTIAGFSLPNELCGKDTVAIPVNLSLEKIIWVGWITSNKRGEGTVKVRCRCSATGAVAVNLNGYDPYMTKLQRCAGKRVYSYK